MNYKVENGPTVVPRVWIRQRQTDGQYINAFMASNKNTSRIENEEYILYTI